MSEQETPVKHQRLAAYAVCLREGKVLLSQLSERTGWPGMWTLPGGGIEHGEDPRDAVVRECWEETGLQVDVGPLLDVDSRHFTGRAPNGTLEDYHSVRLIFAGATASAAVPTVQEIDGSTSAAAWFDLSAIETEIEVSGLVTLGLSLLSQR